MGANCNIEVTGRGTISAVNWVGVTGPTIGTVAWRQAPFYPGWGKVVATVADAGHEERAHDG